ncbi:MAG: hypothetical protein QXZ31_07005 [Thermofilaceae archaeon]
MKKLLLVPVAILLVALALGAGLAQAAPIDVPVHEELSVQANVVVNQGDNIFHIFAPAKYDMNATVIGYAYGDPVTRLTVYINGVKVFQSQPIYFDVAPVRKGETMNVTVVAESSGIGYVSLSLDLMLTFTPRADVTGSRLTVTLESAVTGLSAKNWNPTYTSRIAIYAPVDYAMGERPVSFTDNGVFYSGTPPLPPNRVTVTLRPTAASHPALWTVKYPAGSEEEVAWDGTGRVIVGVELAPKAEGVYTLYLNGTAVSVVKPAKPGVYNLTGLYTFINWTAWPARLEHARAETSFTAFDLKLEPMAGTDPLKIFFTGLAPSLDLRVEVGGAAATVKAAAEAYWNGTVKPVRVPVTVEVNDTARVIRVTPAPVIGEAEPGNEFEKVIVVGSQAAVSPWTPTVTRVTVGSGAMVIYAKGTRPLIATVDPNGRKVLASKDGVHALVPVTAAGDYVLKLETYLTIQNVHEGKLITATVTVYADGVEIARATGETVRFTLEPYVSYTIKGDNGNEVVSTSTFLTQDAALTLTYTRPPAFRLPISTDVLIAVLLIIVIALLVLAVVRGFKIGIEVGG